jgi:hypothetical protein
MVCLGAKEVGLGFLSFASKLAGERWRMVHMACNTIFFTIINISVAKLEVC